jgi:2-succinyl-6-hydroxy-2,4-cyclohexadiene-1-carboxylate synthase
MILQAPGQWRRAVIISASPGLSDPAERAQRVESDRRWAHRFRHDPWDELLAAWNAQSVFTADPPDNTPRAETDYDRELLATALELGSVGLQEDLRDQLRAADCQILWLAGAKDPKYAALAEECAALNPRFRAQIIPDAGHRVLWGNPNALRAALNDFLAE